MKSTIKNWQIFVQCRKSDSSRKELFTHIWNQYQRRLIFFIRNMVKDHAEDLFQEVMLKVFENLDKYNPLYSFNSWIYAIVRNHCLNFIDKKRLPVQILESGDESRLGEKENNSPEVQSLNKELTQKIENILSSFTKENRQIAFLYFFEGLKNREIAQIMDVPTGTIKSRVHKIRTILKNDLENYDG
ncbi:MAG: sigma-70 family RNA polymerase sigma factor [Elusimicrobia bacterium]|nr:sigma-70 family RNA polymerase sigma factor [Elusimicrobiota bacterium]